MTNYTGWQYLLIDLANAFGLDKKLFEARIEWAEQNLHQLESLVDKADSKPLYVSAMLAIRKAQKGLPTGHLVGFDASNSGMQMMSVLTGCITGASYCGLIYPDVRSDAYSSCTELMNELLEARGISVNVSRKDAKNALMTTLYGSSAQPKKIFGEDTPELGAFYEAVATMAPGPWRLLQELLDSWNSTALAHYWQLPDGFEANIRVMRKIEGQEGRIEVDELGGASFTYEFYANQPVQKGKGKSKSNAANVVHSVDAYVLRSIHRRCNYDREVAEGAYSNLQMEIQRRNTGGIQEEAKEGTAEDYYGFLYAETKMADVVILPHLADFNAVRCLTTEHIESLIRVLETMLAHKPFEVVTIHDEFKCHANNMNHLRNHYREILADLADSTTLDYILSNLLGSPVKYAKLSKPGELSKLIRGSAYALC